MSKTVLIDGDGERRGMGWLPDHPDIRDRSADHAEVKPLLAETSVPKLKPKAVPAKVRPAGMKACPPIENQGSLGPARRTPESAWSSIASAEPTESTSTHRAVSSTR